MSSSSSSDFTAEATATYRDHVEAAGAYLRAEADPVPACGLLLGEAAPAILDDVDRRRTRSYPDLPHFPVETEQAKQGTVTIGTLEGTPVIVLDTPLFLRDGHTPRQSAFPVRMLAEAGVERLLLSGRGAGLRPEMAPGEPMLVTNHINFQGANPLLGPNVDDWGPRFPDMTDPYDARLLRAAEQVGRQAGIALRKGVYLGVVGPQLGTEAEYRMMRMLGADAVGTGLIPEVLTARHMGVEVMAVVAIAQSVGADPAGTRSVPDPSERPERPAETRPLHRLLSGVVGSMEGTASLA